MFGRHQDGAIGEVEVASDLMQQGFEVFTPMGDSGPIDLVLRAQEGLFSVQVKSTKTNDGTAKVYFRRTKQTANEQKRKTNEQFDLAAVYVRDKDECLYERRENFGAGLSFKFSEPFYKSSRKHTEYRNAGWSSLV